MFPGISDRRKTALQIIFLLMFIVGIFLLVVSVEKNRSSSGSQRVVFRVDASGGYAIITLDAGNDSISKPTTVTVPWSKSLLIPSGTEVYLTASNPTQTGTLTCTISLGQSQWKTQTTSAPKDGVVCAGIVP